MGELYNFFHQLSPSSTSYTSNMFSLKLVICLCISFLICMDAAPKPEPKAEPKPWMGGAYPRYHPYPYHGGYPPYKGGYPPYIGGYRRAEPMDYSSSGFKCECH